VQTDWRLMTGALEYSGCALSFSLEGEGPPVVFILGVGVHGRGWKPQTDDLRSEFRCLSFDNRGMGASQPQGTTITVDQMAQDTLRLMDHVEWDSAHVVGHSLGGPVALELALTVPDRVRSLSLLCTIARGRDAARLTRRMLWLGLRSNVGTRRSRRRAFLEIILPQSALQGVDRDVLASELEPLFGHDLAEQPSIAMKQLAALRAYDATERLARIDGIPTLVLSATHDPIAPPVFGRALASAIRNAEYVEFPQASHGLPIHQAAETNALLKRHLTKAEAARTLA
jgi:pimeloyl-ACP methyl ester carboxylesterase